MFDALSQPRGYHDAFATAQAGCSAGERLHAPGGHCPGQIKAEVFCAIHDTTTLLNNDAFWLSFLQVLGVGASSQDTWQFQTFFPCVSVSITRLDGGAALGLGCCAATAQRCHHCCRSECCKRSLQDMIVCAFSAGDGSIPPGGTAAAALGMLRLGCCAWRPSPLKVSCWRARKTHATFSPSLRCVSFLCH